MVTDAKNLRIESLGNPDFWQTATAVNPEAVLACHAFHDYFDLLHTKPVHGKVAVAIGRMMDVTFKSLGAVILLALNGFDTDAMRIARSMFEYEVISSYLRKHPELVDDYNDFLYASCQEEFDFLMKHAPELLKNQPPDVVEKMMEQLKNGDRFRNAKGKIKNSWKDVSIAKMAEETERAHVYQTIYRWGSGFVHGDITSIATAFDLENGHVMVGPSTEWTYTALRTAHHAMLCFMRDFNEEAKLGFDEDMHKAMEAFKHAWSADEEPANG